MLKIERYKVEQQMLTSALRNEPIEFTDSFNLKHFYSVLNRHRLHLFYQSLISEYFNGRNESIYKELHLSSQHGLLQATVSRDLAVFFSGIKVNAIFIKGQILSYQIFKSLGKRHSLDIDLVVDRNQFEAVVKTLIEAGSTLINPKKLPEGKRLGKYLEAKHSISLRYPKGQVILEIHVGVHSTNLITKSDSESLLSDTIEVDFFGKRVKTLNNENNFIYLCAHGAQHMFFRLFWLKDIELFLLTQEIDFKIVKAMVNRLNYSRIVGLSMVIVEKYSTMDIPPELHEYIKERRIIERLVRMCEKRIFYPSKWKVVEFFRLTLYLLLLKGGFRNRLLLMKYLFDRLVLRAFYSVRFGFK